jgi:hypothetical protein
MTQAMQSKETTPTRFEVLEVSSAGRAVIVAGRLLAGEVREDMILETGETSGQWRVSGLAFIPAEAWAQGMRGLSLIPLETGASIQPGQVLEGRPAPVTAEDSRKG